MLEINLTPFPVLQSDRFTLRRVIRDDVPGIYNMRSNPEVMRFIPRPLSQTPADAEAVFNMMDEKIEQNAGLNWAIALREQPESFLGVIGIFRIDLDNYRGELGYMLLPEHWNKGVVSELIPIILQFGFKTLNLHSIEAIIDPGNHASRRVLEKSGFRQEAYFRENCFWDGQFLDAVVFSVLEKDLF